MSLHCKPVPVQYREYEYGLFVKSEGKEPLSGYTQGIYLQFTQFFTPNLFNVLFIMETTLKKLMDFETLCNFLF